MCLASYLIGLGLGREEDTVYALFTIIVHTNLLFTHTFYNVIDSSYLLCDCTYHISTDLP